VVPRPAPFLATRPTHIRRSCPWLGWRRTVLLMKDRVAPSLPTSPANAWRYSRGTLGTSPTRHSCSHQVRVLVLSAPPRREAISTSGSISLSLSLSINISVKRSYETSPILISWTSVLFFPTGTRGGELSLRLFSDTSHILQFWWRRLSSCPDPCDLEGLNHIFNLV